MRKLLMFLMLGVTTWAFAQAPIGKTEARVRDDFISAKPAENLPAEIATALGELKVAALTTHIAFLASPALSGRGLPSSGLDAACEYVAATLALAGVPQLVGRNGEKSTAKSYFQEVPVREITNLDGELVVGYQLGNGATTRGFIAGADFLLPELPPSTITAPVVFAGFGIREPKLNHDDLAHLDVRGKIVLILGGVPAGEKWQKRELIDRYAATSLRSRYAAKAEALGADGAIAVLVVEEGDFAPHKGKDAPEKRFFVPFDEPTGDDRRPPLVRVSRTVADALFLSVSFDAGKESSPCELPGMSVTLKWNGAERLVTSRNVIGVIKGSDPILAEQAVIIGAHLDHLGQTAGGFYPGADDNASGVAALCEIARIWNANPRKTKRSVVFAFWTGEEEGRLGSGYWVRHPLWPLSRTSAYLNLDMIAHPWSLDEIRQLVKDTNFTDGEAFFKDVDRSDFIEPGVADWAGELGVVLGRAARGTGVTLHLDRVSGTQGGSDYRDFARAHVPWIRFFGNYFPAYHETGDTPETVDGPQVAKMARLCLATAYLLADQ